MAKLKTGRHTSALKENRRSKRRASYNRGIKKQIKETAKEFIASLDAGNIKKSSELLAKVYAKWDKATKTGTIHWKTAARKKSQMAKALKKKKGA
jgi:small subunit ribosomal protein S20